MDALTDAPLALTLGALALLDGLSVGTLLVPLFFLIAPGRVRSGRVRSTSSRSASSISPWAFSSCSAW